MYRIIVKAYDPQGNEVFAEQEHMGDTFQKAAQSVARALGFAQTDLTPLRRNPSRKPRKPRRRKAATSATGPEPTEGGAQE